MSATIPPWLLRCSTDRLRQSLDDHDFILRAFSWSLTAEGSNYWQSVNFNGHTDESKDKISSMIDQIASIGINDIDLFDLHDSIKQYDGDDPDKKRHFPINVPIVIHDSGFYSEICRLDMPGTTSFDWWKDNIRLLAPEMIHIMALMVGQCEDTRLTSNMVCQLGHNQTIVFTEDGLVVNGEIIG